MASQHGFTFTRDPSTLRLTSHEREPEDEDLFVWDVPDPFAQPDPSMAQLRALIQAEVERMRRYESIGPLQSLPDDVQPLDDWYESDDDDDDDYDWYEDYDDGDDGDDEESDDGDDEENDDDSGKPMAVPKLLHAHPLRFLPSPNPFHPPSPPPPPPPPPPPYRFWSPFFDSVDDNRDSSGLAHIYDDVSEAEERAARKAKRDAYRSRLKALAVLGPEAASAICI